MFYRPNTIDFSESSRKSLVIGKREYRSWCWNLQNLEDYELYISANNGPEHLFLNQKSFNDPFAEFLCVEAIDRDGKQDFIFGANRDYEEEPILLY